MASKFGGVPVESQSKFGGVAERIEDDGGLPAIPGSPLDIQRQQEEAQRQQQIQSQPTSSIGEKIAGAGDAFLTMASGATTGAFGQVGGLIEGLLKEVASGQFGTDEAANRIEGLMMQRGGEFTRSLKTQEGAKQLAAVAETLSPLSAIPPMAEIQMISSSLNRASLPSRLNKQLIDETTGLPTTTFSKALKKRDIQFGALIGDDENISMFSGAKTPDQFVDDVIKRKLERGDSASALYKFKVDKNGQVGFDALGETAKKQGFREGDIASAKTANTVTRREMVKMLRMKRQIEADSSKALEFRPTDVVGQSAMKRFNFLQGEAKRLRGELDTVASKGSAKGESLLEGHGGLLKGREINTDIVSSQYFKGLDDLGVDVDTTEIPPKLDFSQSLISEDKTSQRVLKSVTNILSKDGKVDAQKAHQLKRQLDTMLDFNKKSATGLTDAGEKFAKQIRRSLNDSIREVSPRYAKINDELSGILDSLNDFSDSLGRVDPFSDNANAAVGQTLRRLLSNVQSRADLDSALTKLDDTAKSFGGEFDTDIRRLIMFNNTLDDRFGATARGSFQGSIESALESGPIAAAKRAAAGKAIEKVQDVRGISDENAFNVMEQILKR